MLDFLQSFRGKAVATTGSTEMSGDPTRTFDAILRAAQAWSMMAGRRQVLRGVHQQFGIIIRRQPPG